MQRITTVTVAEIGTYWKVKHPTQIYQQITKEGDRSDQIGICKNASSAVKGVGRFGGLALIAGTWFCLPLGGRIIMVLVGEMWDSVLFEW